MTVIKESGRSVYQQVLTLENRRSSAALARHGFDGMGSLWAPRKTSAQVADIHSIHTLTRILANVPIVRQKIAKNCFRYMSMSQIRNDSQGNVS